MKTNFYLSAAGVVTVALESAWALFTIHAAWSGAISLIGHMFH